jgi:AcrR family transcriptional regulator
LAQAESATRQTILSAAYAVFTRNGFRGATMDDVAREARLARATLYTHFDGKTDLFRALAIRLVEAELAAARQALDSAAPIETRLIDILAAKIAPIVEINARSPHARELQDEFRRLGEDIHRSAWARYHELVRRLLRQAQANGEIDPARAGFATSEVAELLVDCAHGIIANPGSAARASAYRKRLTRLVRTFLSAMRPERRRRKAG